MPLNSMFPFLELFFHELCEEDTFLVNSLQSIYLPGGQLSNHVVVESNGTKEWKSFTDGWIPVASGKYIPDRFKEDKINSNSL